VLFALMIKPDHLTQRVALLVEQVVILVGGEGLE
jgi:hypothetical protein